MLYTHNIEKPLTNFLCLANNILYSCRHSPYASLSCSSTSTPTYSGVKAHHRGTQESAVFMHDQSTNHISLIKSK